MDIKKMMVSKPVIGRIANYEEIFWINPQSGKEADLPFSMDDIDDAEARLLRFAPYIASAFPETAKTGGIIESKLIPIPKMKESRRNRWASSAESFSLNATVTFPYRGL